MATASVTWLGHASFRIDSSGGKRIYVDPWLDGNPKCPESEQQAERADLVLCTHAHFDHVAAAVDLGKRFECPVVCMVELGDWFVGQGYPEAQVRSMNKGGTQDVDGIKVTMTNAFHSSSTPDGTYGGEPTGLVVELENGRKVYFAGDTTVFGDMQLIGRLYSPDVAVLPIGDHYTMGPREAGLALELLGVRRCIPSHWGTFPLLTGTPDELRRHAPQGVEIVDVSPGQTIDL
jgi:L-ascorbate metabolism protein UlaG (beta-lactamase superfamily)